ncbi:spliceosome-associated protein CWC27 homolog [Anopheles arabiensis]|uniref:Spliceosome-associated protein CWC27 homolog n=1 Tax=Anopheles arabiensis TaxID=7173 RepID=A0A182I3V9_ANOAR|nr:spliceosome-associated protein CWC27 homolog [Anopheles arabiensis]
MSNIYIQEPPTSGKVLLKTSVGDIDIELWSKECPLACRNFIQLCLEGYYNGTIFHRVVKGFIVQGGDPNGDGTGGESVYGHPFKDEFHSRLRYVRRGLVGMANSGRNDNASQFFFTMGPTPELQNQNTLFGKVAGDTIYNMLKLEEGEVYENERPHFTHRIIRTEVLNNPFDDIVPRRTGDADRAKSKQENENASKKKKEKGVKNFGLLSFGDEAEEEELETQVYVQKNASGRGKSSHDVLDDPQLSKQTASTNAEEDSKTRRRVDSSDDEAVSSPKSDEQEAEQHRTSTKASRNKDGAKSVREKLKRKPDEKAVEKKPHASDASESDSDSDYGLGSERKKAKQQEAEKIRQEITKLKRDYHTDKRSKDKDKESEQKKVSKKSSRKEVMDEVLKVQEEYTQKTKQVPKKGSSRENFTMELLQKFKSKLHSAHERDPESHASASVDEEEDIRGDNWLSHRLEFEKKDPILAKDAATKDDDWYDVYDPRNPLNKRKRGEKIERTQKPRK